MTPRLLCFAAFCALLPASLTRQAQVAGRWEVQLDTTAAGTSAFVLLEQEGEQLRGLRSGGGAPDAAIVGSVSGDSVQFSFELEGRRGQHRFTVRAALVENWLHGWITITGPNGAEIGAGREWHARRAPTDAGRQTENDTSVRNGTVEARVEEVLRDAMTAQRWPGAVAAYATIDGRTGTVAVGLADRELGRVMETSDRFLAGSVGKTFVAATVLTLAADGVLGLDQPISKWLGEESWFDSLPNGHATTIRMLLNHSSGLTNHVYDPDFQRKVAASSADPETDPEFAFEPRELIGFVLGDPPRFPPGEGYAYTDTGYILLGLIAERATGGTYYDLLKDRFLEPLGLRSTVPATRRDLPGLVPGYLARNNPLGLPTRTVDHGQMVINPATEWTGGGLLSKPTDLVRWAVALYHGDALPARWRDEMIESTAPGGAYGLGVSIGRSPLGASWGHDGWFPGYRTKLSYFPGHGVAIAIQVNTDVRVDLEGVMAEIAREVIAGD